jgi:hypothetical protein
VNRYCSISVYFSPNTLSPCFHFCISIS